MTAKQDEVAIGFDPLAWMDDESEEKRRCRIRKIQQQLIKELVEEGKPEQVEEKSTID